MMTILGYCSCTTYNGLTVVHPSTVEHPDDLLFLGIHWMVEGRDALVVGARALIHMHVAVLQLR